MLRDDIKPAQIAAMKAGDKARLAARAPDPRQAQGPRHRAAHRAPSAPDDDALVVEVLQKMAKQRRELIALYEQGGRAGAGRRRERAELAVIEEFLPQQMSEAETRAAIEAIKAELGAAEPQGHGPGHGRAEGAPRQPARHGQGERAGEGGALQRVDCAAMSLSPQWLDELRARDHAVRRDRAHDASCSKAGRECKACCPFHNEKTPSFTVNDEKGFYHCFGCGAHGDAIRWMTDQRGLAFMDAVKELAAEAGMEVPAPDPRAAQAAEQRDGAARRHGGGAGVVRRQPRRARGREGARLPRVARVRRAYACERFGFGYAPDGRDRRSRRRWRSSPRRMLIEAGLRIAVDEQGALRPLPRPADDADPRCARAGDRVWRRASSTAAKNDAPKYLNSPDTPLFDKGRTLYNLHRAGPAARKRAG